MRGFVAFSAGYIGLCGILGLLILVPLFTITRAEFVGILAGMSVLFLVWAGIMVLLGALKGEDEWEEIGWFRKFLLLLMTAPIIYVGAYILLGILFVLLIFGAFVGSLSGLSIYSVYTNVGSFWVAIRKWW